MTESQCYNWEFRHSADGEHSATFDEVIQTLKKIGKKWILQKEQGETGYLHWQGTLSLQKKQRKNPLLKLLRDSNLVVFHHINPVHSAAKVFSYVTKLDTCVDGPWDDRQFQEVFIPRQYQNITLRPWQQMIVDQHLRFNSRTINWVYDEEGNHGKSTIAAIMALLHGGVMLPPVNDSQQLLQSVCDILTARECRQPGTIFVDLPRTMGKEKLNGILAACEKIKDGFCYDVRNHYRDWWFHSPQVWIFSNTEYPQSEMSRDRWIRWRFQGQQLIRDEHRGLVTAWVTQEENHL